MPNRPDNPDIVALAGSRFCAKLSAAQLWFILTLSIAANACSPCWGSCGGNKLAEARAEFHRRWNAKQFHEIYLNSEMHRRGHEATYIANWERQWSVIGTFQDDKDEVQIDHSDARYRDSILATRYHNSLYSKAPVIEHFQWRLEDNRTTLMGFDLLPNLVMRCERSLFEQRCADYDLNGTNVTPTDRRPQERDDPLKRSDTALTAFKWVGLLLCLLWLGKELRT